jgi:hypothetical protein
VGQQLRSGPISRTSRRCDMNRGQDKRRAAPSRSRSCCLPVVRGGHESHRQAHPFGGTPTAVVSGIDGAYDCPGLSLDPSDEPTPLWLAQ